MFTSSDIDRSRYINPVYFPEINNYHFWRWLRREISFLSIRMQFLLKLYLWCADKGDIRMNLLVAFDVPIVIVLWCRLLQSLQENVIIATSANRSILISFRMLHAHFNAIRYLYELGDPRPRLVFCKLIVNRFYFYRGSALGERSDGDSEICCVKISVYRANLSAAVD
jgi:hypothetical protein